MAVAGRWLTRPRNFAPSRSRRSRKTETKSLYSPVPVLSPVISPVISSERIAGSARRFAGEDPPFQLEIDRENHLPWHVRFQLKRRGSNRWTTHRFEWRCAPPFRSRRTWYPIRRNRQCRSRWFEANRWCRSARGPTRRDRPGRRAHRPERPRGRARVRRSDPRPPQAVSPPRVRRCTRGS